MKKENLLFIFGILCCLLTSSRQASAQFTKLDVYSSDSFSSFCSIPSTRTIGIYVAGTPVTAPSDTLTIYVNYGDGSDTTFTLMPRPMPYYTVSVSHVYSFAGSFGSRVIATTPTGVADTFDGTVYPVSNTCGTLNGFIYQDKDLDCTKDAADSGINWMPVLAVNTATKDTIHTGWSNDSGYYNVGLPPATYDIIPTPYYSGWGFPTDTNIIPSCTGGGIYTLTVAPGGSYTKDFGYTCKSISTYDASVLLSSRGFVPGDSTFITVSAYNWSWYYHFTCASLSSTITLTLDPKLTYSSVQSGFAPTSVSGSTVTWTLSSTVDVTRFMSTIWVKVPTTATIGDTIRLSAYIAPTSFTDPDLSNNTFNYKRPVVSSYDPNMKEVAPAGDGAPGYIQNKTKLTYIIHFQNTGTAPAKNITVADEIDEDLDLNTLHLLSTSHSASLHMEGRTAKFRFDNINLPDSGTNMNASMGTIVYGIMPKKDLAPGTQMTNKAAIFFDYNAPIITNTTLNTTAIPTFIETVSTGNIAVQVFPNPAHTELNIKLNNGSHFSVQVTDMLGRKVTSQSSDTGTMVIATQSLPSGLYLVNIRDIKGNELNTKIVVKH